jgi:hypothetical protein
MVLDPQTATTMPARTDEMLQFVADMALPIQENFLPHEDGQPLPMGSIAATLTFAARQQTAREEGQATGGLCPTTARGSFLERSWSMPP